MYGKYVVPLEGHGMLFRQTLRNIGVPDTPRNMGQHIMSDVEYVYNECVSQVMIAMSPDLQTYLKRLQLLPDFAFFEHLDVLKDPRNRAILKQAIAGFGFSLIDIIHRYIGRCTASEYYLEQSAPDFLVVSRLARQGKNDELHNW